MLNQFDYDKIISKALEVKPKKVSMKTPVSFDAVRRGLYRSVARFKDTMSGLDDTMDKLTLKVSQGTPELEGDKVSFVINIWFEDIPTEKFTLTIL